MQIVKEYGITDAVCLLYEMSGDYASAFALIKQVCQTNISIVKSLFYTKRNCRIWRGIAKNWEHLELIFGQIIGLTNSGIKLSKLFHFVRDVHRVVTITK